MDISPKLIVVNDLTATTGGNLTINTGTFTILAGVPADSFNVYRVIGSPTLTSDLDIVASGTLLKNLYVEIYNKAVIDGVTNNKDLTIFGASVPREFITSNFKAECLYDGSAWNITILPSMDGTGLIAAKLLASNSVTTAKILDLNVTTAKINDLAVTTGKLAANAVTAAKITAATITTTEIAAATITAANIAAGTITTTEIAATTIVAGNIANSTITATQIAAATITVDKLEANANKYTRDITLSFQQASEVGAVNFTICEHCTIDEINVTVLDPAVTDTATLIYKDNGGVVLTASQTDITTGLAIGNVVSTTPTANNVFAAGDNLLIEMSKTTKTSGKVNVALCITKT
jgi:hypothetical protein